MIVMNCYEFLKIDIYCNDNFHLSSLGFTKTMLNWKKYFTILLQTESVLMKHLKMKNTKKHRSVQVLDQRKFLSQLLKGVP